MWKAVPHVSHKLTKPVIAATQGWVIGGAICMVMTCDLMVSADTTKFMYPEAKVGVFGGLMPGIVSRMPHKVAMELLLLGEEISVKRAYDVGFVNKVVPLGEERKEARRMARIIAESAPLVIRTLRDFANQTLPRGPAEIFVPERYKLERIAGSEDRKEGAAAFREKRRGAIQGQVRGHGRSCCWSVAARWAAPCWKAGWRAGSRPRMSIVAEPVDALRPRTEGPALPSPRPPTWPETPEIVVLAVKPQSMDGVLPDLKRFADEGAVFLSIAAGKTLKYFASHLGATAKIVRSMPNTPAAVRQGISVATAARGVSEAEKKRCHRAARSRRPGRCGSTTRP